MQPPSGLHGCSRLVFRGPAGELSKRRISLGTAVDIFHLPAAGAFRLRVTLQLTFRWRAVLDVAFSREHRPADGGRPLRSEECRGKNGPNGGRRGKGGARR